MLSSVRPSSLYPISLTAALSGQARSNMVALNMNSRLLLENYGGFLVFYLGNRNWQEWCEASYISYPEFSRSGNYAYFSDSTTGFFRVRLGSNKVEPVATIDSAGAIKPDEFWYWTGLTPDDSPLFLRDTSTREIYALDVDFP